MSVSRVVQAFAAIKNRNVTDWENRGILVSVVLVGESNSFVPVLIG